MSLFCFGNSVSFKPIHIDEKESELINLASIYRHNYSFLEIKEYRCLGEQLSFEELKNAFKSRVALTQTNDEYYRELKAFVACFEDSHNNLFFNHSNVEGVSSVATLGFLVERYGEDLIVIGPAGAERITNDKGSSKPKLNLLPKTINIEGKEIELFKANKEEPKVLPGDIIKSINGVKPREYVLKYLRRYFSLGDEEANFTFLSSKITQRSSLSFPMPEAKEVLLVIQRGNEESTRKIIRKWKIIDESKYVYFKNPSRFSNPKVGKALKCLVPFFRKRDRGCIPYGDKGVSKLFYMGRYYPGVKANIIHSAKIFPAYYVENENEKMGYILIDSFNPKLGFLSSLTSHISQARKLKNEINSTLKILKKHGVDKVVIDLLDNGGGSLAFLDAILVALAGVKPIDNISIKPALNSEWAEEILNPNNTLVDENLVDDVKDSLEINSVLTQSSYSYKEIYSNNKALQSIYSRGPELDYSFEYVVLVSEKNMSAGDILPAVIQDSGLGKIVGVKTIGGGGNIIPFKSSGPSNYVLSLTSSVIYRSNGELIENKGVIPDIKYDGELSIDRYNGFKDIISRALNGEYFQ